MLIIEGLFDRPVGVTLSSNMEGKSVCFYCGETFTPKGSDHRKYCSKECYNRAKALRNIDYLQGVQESLGFTPCKACLKSPPTKGVYCLPCWERTTSKGHEDKAQAKLNHKCLKCGGPTYQDSYLCEPHWDDLQKRSKASKAKWRAETPVEVKRATWKRYAGGEKVNERLRKRYAQHKDEGKCVACGGPNLLGPGNSPYCATHKKKKTPKKSKTVV